MRNLPPKQYLINDIKFPEKITKINPKEIDISSVPLAGRLSEVGQRILSLGTRKARGITTMNWGFGFPNTEVVDNSFKVSARRS